MSQSIKKWGIIGVVVIGLGAFFAFGGQNLLTLENLKAQQAGIQEFYQNNQIITIAMYMGIYILVTALSLPGASILTLAGGAFFGLVTGGVVVSFASTIGASCAFLVARYLFKESVQQKFGDRLKTINEGVEKEGAFYLFTLRLIPAFPFFLINLLMGVTPIRLSTFFFVSQIGMLPGTLVYVNAGTQLAQIDSLQGILSPSLLISFALLGAFPLITKKAMQFFRKQPVRS
ncbi:MAG: TVP38/TMEM64 family protein [Pseudobacteriovorax sp.]|nr:TVP38/TMEM64 family protein [Pseudobacteriovorax sp.]